MFGIKWVIHPEHFSIPTRNILKAEQLWGMSVFYLHYQLRLDPDPTLFFCSLCSRLHICWALSRQLSPCVCVCRCWGLSQGLVHARKVLSEPSDNLGLSCLHLLRPSFRLHLYVIGNLSSPQAPFTFIVFFLFNATQLYILLYSLSIVLY